MKRDPLTASKVLKVVRKSSAKYALYTQFEH